MKKIVINMLVLLVVLGVIGAGAVFYFKPSLISTTKSSDTALVKERLVELSEWTTLKYEYSKVIISRSSKNVPLIDIKLAEAIKLIEYDGYLKAGTDLSKLQLSYGETTKQLFVKVPNATILDNVADTDTARVTDVKGDIFSDYQSQQIFDDINKEKRKIEEKKIKQGFLKEADLRIKKLLTSFLKTNGYNDVTIEFY
ncbi:DUF4230 domain-containing protein [Exiguobacterium sp. RIT594]|uniref:DUF4230 domain-containing protein n=1 Tax=Exiguobacterium sp. RIT594 TaxID=2282449 RepID=UPI000DF7AC73|nr:DUF4230 domain-containing protein [Exiguobacterium sp. RIT594]RDB33037.1 DUF4230 domain-containing protein [Exiguobacterium sp. RIT594]